MSLTARYDFNEHEEIWLLLPWLANGRLPDALRERALQHAQRCTACTQELQVQQQLCAALAVPERISYAPGTSLGKLMRRIEAAHASSAHRLLAALPVGQRAARLWRPAGLAWAATCLLTAGLGGSLALRELAPAYQVRTDTAAPAGGVLHVIFVRTLTVGEVESLLRADGAQLVEGPAGETGVFGVRPLSTIQGASHGTNPDAVRRLAAQLRHDPRVRWIEPLATAGESVASFVTTSDPPNP